MTYVLTSTEEMLEGYRTRFQGEKIRNKVPKSESGKGTGSGAERGGLSER
tara:strand:+ start:581 stop:730 length:150 start_codon:yes stop_codon:yes gene_type:complete